MSLVDVTASLQTAILADPRCPSGLVFNFGAETLAFEDAPPRIIWVPMPSHVMFVPMPSQTQNPNGLPNPGGYQYAFNPRSVATRQCSIEAHCWGASTSPTAQASDHYQAAELLENLLVCALYNVAEGVSRGTTEDPRKPDNIQLGWLISLTFEIDLPVTLPDDEVVVVDTGEIAFSP